LLAWVSGSSRSVLLAIFLGGYVLSVMLFAVGYQLTSSTNAGNFVNNIYFSLITQATVGYGDVLPLGEGKILASAQILVGLVYIAIVPAIVVVRLITPDPGAIRISSHVVFDADAQQFRFRYVAWSRLAGRSGRASVTLRHHVPDTARNVRNLRVHLAGGGAAPNTRPQVPYFMRTERCSREPHQIHAQTFDIVLHPAHIATDATISIELSFQYTFGTAWQDREFGRLEVLCGQLVSVENENGVKDWSNFDTVVRIESTPEGRSFCLTKCQLRDTCLLVNRVPDT
jgi:hypothetical protein